MTIPTINEAANVIARFSRDLAAMFREQPFERVNIALAFARGFVANESDDIHPSASIVLEAAFADRDSRAV